MKAPAKISEAQCVCSVNLDRAIHEASEYEMIETYMLFEYRSLNTVAIANTVAVCPDGNASYVDIIAPG